jgi:hypothetical protein
MRSLTIFAADGQRKLVRLSHYPRIPDGNSSETMTQGIASDACLARSGARASASLRIASIGGNFAIMAPTSATGSGRSQ